MTLRQANIDQLEKDTLDVLVVGGGINGAVSAAALAAKGVKVGLLDKGDFASHSSSASSNLAWGGIKYLESFEYGLVWKLCKSRNHLMRAYPSKVKEIRFLTTLEKGFRFPTLAVYLGTLLYWGFGRFFTQPPKWLSVAEIKQREPIVQLTNAKGGFEYSDSYLIDNDARFVFDFVRKAMDYGCLAANYVEVERVEYQQSVWNVAARCNESNRTLSIKAKVLVNACGPFVDQMNAKSKIPTDYHHLFSKGIHLIVDRVTPSNKVLTFFASDGRLFFVIPMGPKTCIGTTDTQIDGPKAVLTPEDREFVLTNANRCLKLDQPLTLADIISERCGVRPLVSESSTAEADWVKMSRKHQLEVDSNIKHISIFGGKLTDCINVGEQISQTVSDLGIQLQYPNKRWYGEPAENIRTEFMHQSKLLGLDHLTAATSSEKLSTRLWRRYGDDAFELLEWIREDKSEAELLIENTEYIKAEVRLAARREMITRLEDFLRRRSKISQVVRQQTLLTAPGLKLACELIFGDESEAKLKQYIQSQGSESPLQQVV